MITYTDSLSGVDADMLTGFLQWWRNPPSTETCLRMLRGSDHVLLAQVEDQPQRHIVGFVSAVTDGANFAYISLLAVLPDYRGQGIGRELMRQMLHRLGEYPCIDLTCDPELQSFYEQCGMQRSVGMIVRDYSRPGPAPG